MSDANQIRINELARELEIKAKVLIAKATFDPKTSKLTAPPGCVDAYQHFLALQPDGPNAQEAKDVLAGLGEKIDTKYKAPAKH